MGQESQLAVMENTDLHFLDENSLELPSYDRTTTFGLFKEINKIRLSVGFHKRCALHSIFHSVFRIFIQFKRLIVKNIFKLSQKYPYVT